MGIVHVIKFQEVEEREEKVSAVQYRTKFVGVEDHYHLKYLRHIKESDFFAASNNYQRDSDDTNVFVFKKTVQIVGYSTDIPLILNVDGKDRVVLMPNYVGTPEMLPIDSDSTPLGSIIGISRGSMIRVKEGLW